MPHSRSISLLVFVLTAFFTYSLQAQTRPLADTTLVQQLLMASNSNAAAGNFDEAMSLVDSAGVICEQIRGKNSRMYLQILLQKGRLFNFLDQLDSAMANVKMAEEILPKLSGKNRDMEASIYGTLGECFRAKQEYDQAISYQEKALAILIDEFGETNANVPFYYNNTAVIYETINNFDKALAYYEKARELWQKIFGEAHPNVGLAYNNIGVVYKKLGKYDQALPYAKKALEVMIKAVGEEHNQTADAYFNVAGIYGEKGDYDNALIFTQRAYDIKLKIFGEGSPELVNSLGNLGALYGNKADNVHALFCLEKAANTLEQYANTHPVLANIYDNISVIYSDKGDHDRALNYLNKALNIANAPNFYDQRFIPICYISMGSEYQARGENTLALTYFEKALELFLKLFGEDNADVASAYVNIGFIQDLLGDSDKAIAYYEKANAIFAKNFGEDHARVAENYQRIGISYRNKEQYAQALSYQKKALEMQLKKLGDIYPDVTASYNDIGFTYFKMGDYEQSIAAYAKALPANGYQADDLKNVGNLEYLINTFHGLGGLSRRLYEKNATPALLENARSYFLKSFQVMDTLRNTFAEGGSKQLLLQTNYIVYEGMLKTEYLLFQKTHSLSYLQEAFQFASRAKSQLLQEAMQETDALRFAGLPDSLLQQEYDLRINITFNEKQKQELLNSKLSETDTTVVAIGAKVFDLKQKYEKLKKRFTSDYPDYYRLKYNQEAISANEVQQKLLQPNQAMLEYFVGDSSLFVFVIRPDTLVMQEIKKDFPLEDWVKSLRENIYQNRTTGATAYAEAAYNLYQKLILPIKSLLPEQVIIIPDGILGYVPFEALLTANPERAIRFNTHAYLLKQHQISYCYSATLLREMQQKKRVKEPNNTLLAVAPFYTGDTTLLAGIFAYDETTRKDLAPLQHSGEEVYRINKLWKGDVLTGADATETKFTERVGDYRILHLATHGRADERVGDYSFLAFSEIKDSVENELLYVRDLYNLQLNADLVVLSACETGLGKLSRGEGIISLARAFAYAGAKSIVTTLWSVDDAKTKDLMVDFYRKLKKGMAKDAALRQAKLDYLTSHTNPADAHPFYWAGFAPIGDMRALR